MVVQNDMMKESSQGYMTAYSRTEYTSNITSGEKVLTNSSNTSKQNTSSKTPQTEENNIADTVIVSIKPKSKQRDVVDFELKRDMDDLQGSITQNQKEDMTLAEISEKLYKITQLSIEAQNESNTPADRREIQDEINKLRLEIRGITTGDSLGTGSVSVATPTQDKTVTDLSKNIAGVYEDAVEHSPNVAINYNDILKKIADIDVTTTQGIENAIKQTTEATNYIEQARMYIAVENNRLQNIVTTSNNIDRHLAGLNLDASYVPSKEYSRGKHADTNKTKSIDDVTVDNVFKQNTTDQNTYEQNASDTIATAKNSILQHAKDSINAVAYGDNAMALSLLQ